MLNLLVKDLKLLLFGDNTSLKKKIFSLAFTVIFLGLYSMEENIIVAVWFDDGVGK